MAPSFSSLLRRQLRKYLGKDYMPDPELEPFLVAVDRAYNDYKADQGLLEHALTVSSQELSEANKKLQKESEIGREVMERLRLLGDRINEELGYPHFKTGDYSTLLEQVEILSDAFKQNQIAQEALRRAKKEIEEYSKTLEQKVAERTGELMATNRQLESEIEYRKEAEARKEVLISDLQKSLNEVKTLQGLLPICTSCKKIRDDTGYWNQIESYIGSRSEAQFSHGICPDCARKLYGAFYREGDEKL